MLKDQHVYKYVCGLDSSELIVAWMELHRI